MSDVEYTRPVRMDGKGPPFLYPVRRIITIVEVRASGDSTDVVGYKTGLKRLGRMEG